MEDARFSHFSSWFEYLSRALSTGWGFSLGVVWIFCALIGAGNLFLKAGGFLPAYTPAYEAMGPAEALTLGSAASAASAAATSAPQTAHIGISPARLEIPVIGVNAPVVSVGLTKGGAVGTPPNFTSAAWYDGSSEPGASGNAVIDGHVNNALTKAGVFEHLNDLRLGDEIDVADASGSVRRFKVVSEQLYAADDAPTGEIFKETGPASLVLITCNGAWDQGKKEFNERLVVYAALEGESA